MAQSRWGTRSARRRSMRGRSMPDGQQIRGRPELEGEAPGEPYLQKSRLRRSLALPTDASPVLGIPVGRRGPGEDEQEDADDGDEEDGEEAAVPAVVLDEGAQAPAGEDGGGVAEDAGEPD